MSKHILFINGILAARYDSEINPDIPASAIEVSDAIFWQTINEQDGVWSMVSGEVIKQPLPVGQIRAAAWERIKAERQRRTEQGGYKVGTKWFHSDQFSRTQQVGLVLLGTNIPSGLQWKTLDGSFVTMTPTLAGQIFTAAAASDVAIFTVAETHRAAMEASANPAAYDFSGGWPLIYGE